jgi:hypothetical protein
VALSKFGSTVALTLPLLSASCLLMLFFNLSWSDGK